MAQVATLLRFHIELSDIDRSFYGPLDFRVAQHPSENAAFMITRVLAYALNIREGLEFTPGGLSDADEPCIRAQSLMGTTELWIEVGNPSMKKLNKAMKGAPEVKIYTYKDPLLLLKDIEAASIYRGQEAKIFSIAPEFLQRIEKHLVKNNRWGLIHTDGSLILSIGEKTEQGELVPHSATQTRG
jgi:uncharacterized protein YaeQ